MAKFDEDGLVWQCGVKPVVALGTLPSSPLQEIALNFVAHLASPTYMWGQLWYCLPIAQLGNLAGGGPQGGVECHRTPLSSLPKNTGWMGEQAAERSCHLLRAS